MTASHATLDARRFDPPAHAAWPTAPSAGTATFAESPTPRRLASTELLAGSPEVLIEHGEATYRLRLTALGKLILTK